MLSQMVQQRMLYEMVEVEHISVIQMDPLSPFPTPVGELSSNYRVEVQALIIATKHLTAEGQHNIVLFTDSLSALQSPSSGHTDHSTKLLQIKLTFLAQSRKVTIQWIPAHIGVAGNEKADQLAKTGSCLPQTQPPSHTMKPRFF
ncbi:ribonuclease HI-like [Gigantopelta aegis]|uniref:ribonuclease HI-like n=1 Tax=Gigantopelta aegis TaxID=1735272 RepID=UPI001B88A183|nr:ribonuclease HI-like [Gigantopelta aegis]